MYKNIYIYIYKDLTLKERQALECCWLDTIWWHPPNFLVLIIIYHQLPTQWYICNSLNFQLKIENFSAREWSVQGEAAPFSSKKELHHLDLCFWSWRKHNYLVSWYKDSHEVLKNLLNLLIRPLNAVKKFKIPWIDI